MAARLEIQHLPLWDRIAAKRMPVSFDMELTARCNNDCRHCYINLPAGDRAAQAAELSSAEILDIARQAADMGAVWCLLTGGEPLLRADFEDIYLSLRRLGLLVSVFTNATLITEEHVALFRKYPPRDMEVTVYASTRETYDRVTRRPGSWDRFQRGMRLLLESGVRLRLKATVMNSNLHEYKEMAEYCRARTKDYYRFDPLLHLRLDGDPTRNAEIRSERLTPEQIVALEQADDERSDALREKCDILINEEFTRSARDRLFCCGAGKASFSVSYDGRFRLCSALVAEETTYDLRAGSLADAWSRFTPLIQDLRSERVDFLESCRKCAIVNLCLWCPAHSHLESGRMDTRCDYFCRVAHARADAIRNHEADAG